MGVTSRYTQYEHSDNSPPGSGCLLPLGHLHGCSCSCSYRSPGCISPRTFTRQTPRPQGICSRQCVVQQPPLMEDGTPDLSPPLTYLPPPSLYLPTPLFLPPSFPRSCFSTK